VDIKYSQDNEEDIIMRYLPKVVKGKYIDIGCAGTDLSNTYYFYQKGWRGIIIDPGLEYRESYGWGSKRSEDIFLPIAITDYDGEVEMCDAATVGSWLGDKYKFNESEGKPLYTVKCMTIPTLLSLYPDYKVIDLLSIDIETNEDKVLSKCDFSVFKPTLICIEYHCRGVDMRGRWEHFLTPYYDLKEIMKYGCNAFYLRKR
jgi:FkbM family methyltransferase